VELVRKELKIRLGQLHRRRRRTRHSAPSTTTAYRAALQAARRVLLAMRDSGDIGDDAFHTLENDLDWMEVSDPLRAAECGCDGVARRHRPLHVDRSQSSVGLFRPMERSHARPAVIHCRLATRG
jgi:hypothetical protein